MNFKPGDYVLFNPGPQPSSGWEYVLTPGKVYRYEANKYSKRYYFTTTDDSGNPNGFLKQYGNGFTYLGETVTELEKILYRVDIQE